MPARSGFESFTGLMISARATPAVRAEAKKSLRVQFDSSNTSLLLNQDLLINGIDSSNKRPSHVQKSGHIMADISRTGSESIYSTRPRIHPRVEKADYREHLGAQAT
jgi:hypothetical protein